MDNTVYIVILNYVNWKDTIECLQSVLQSNYQNFKVVVVDNSPTLESVDRITEFLNSKSHKPLPKGSPLPQREQTSHNIPESWKYFHENELNPLYGSTNDLTEHKLYLVKTKGNYGYAAGNNVGIRLALHTTDAKYILILNNDTVIDESALTNWVDHMSKQSTEDCKAGLCGGKVLNYFQPKNLDIIAGKLKKHSSSIQHVGNEIDRGQYNHGLPAGVTHITGCALFFPVDYVKDVGLLDEDFFLFWEEVEWALRGNDRGWSISYAPNVVVFHKHGGSRAQEESSFSEYHLLRSTFLFHTKRYSYSLPYVFLKEAFVFVRKIIRKPKATFRLYYKVLIGFFRPMGRP